MTTAPNTRAAVPALSVVIATLGRPILIQTLESLLRAQAAERLEILVVGRLDDPRVAGAVRALQRCHPAIRHLPVAFAAGDSSEKKNAGWRAARADCIAFLDDDVVVAPDWPARIREPFDQPGVGLVSGPGLVPDDLPLAARLAGCALSSWAAGYVAARYLSGPPRPRPARWSALIGCNMAYRRPVLEAIGGFDPAFWPGEEMIAAYRATRGGHQLVFHPAAVVRHYPRSSPGRFARQMFGYGATRIRLMRAGVEIEPTTLFPAAWVLGLAVLLGAAPFHRGAAALLGAALALYAAGCLAAATAAAWRSRQWRDLLVVFLIPLMHAGYGVGQWVELLRPNTDLSEQPKA